ncbi:MAG: ABC transporter substrate-binding protein [Sandaracinaceae bacterium]|nr:ABC transporter substrate-binding protein [Sandaracinaceae bacterium]
MVLLLGTGCDGGGGGSDAGTARDAGGTPTTRMVTGLTSCSVALPGYYYLGAALPITGPLPVGEGMEKAILTALTNINDNGGIDGHSVGLVTCDSACDGTAARAALTELAGAELVSGVVGCGCSGATIPASEVAIAQGIVMISPSATSPAITDIVDDGWLNRTAPSDALQGKIMAAIANREGLTDVFVINRDDPYGNGLRDVFIENFEFLGGTTDFVTYSEDTAGFADTVIAAAEADGAPGVFMISFTTDGAAIAQTAISRGFDPGVWMFPDGLRDNSFVEAVGNDAFLEGAFGTIPASPTGANFATFSARFTELWGEGPGPFGANAYDAAMLIAISMALGDPENRTSVRDNLRNTSTGTVVNPEQWDVFLGAASAGMVNYEGAAGPVDLDENGEPVSNVEEWTITSGAIQTAGCWTPDATPCP